MDDHELADYLFDELKSWFGETLRIVCRKHWSHSRWKDRRTFIVGLYISDPNTCTLWTYNDYAHRIRSCLMNPVPLVKPRVVWYGTDLKHIARFEVELPEEWKKEAKS